MADERRFEFEVFAVDQLHVATLVPAQERAPVATKADRLRLSACREFADPAGLEIVKPQLKRPPVGVRTHLRYGALSSIGAEGQELKRALECELLDCLAGCCVPDLQLRLPGMGRV